MTSPLRIATRASELALRQARLVQAALSARGRDSELVTFRTTGDRKLDEPLSAIGGKGLFTHELEVALRKGKVDCCVHSLKDLPTDSPDGLEIAAVLEREDPRDALVINKVAEANRLEELPAGSRVGTSSLRRRAQLLAIRPDLEVVDLRGNVPTRLKKVDSGQVHAAILAAAGLIRLDARSHISEFFESPAWLPAPGQGAIAIQARTDAEGVIELLRSLNHAPTYRAVAAERAFLSALEGGCQVPIAALMTDSSGSDVLHGLVSDLRGATIIRGETAVGADPVAAGRELAEHLRARGANSLLVELNAATSIPAPQPE